MFFSLKDFADEKNGEKIYEMLLVNCLFDSNEHASPEAKQFRHSSYGDIHSKYEYGKGDTVIRDSPFNTNAKGDISSFTINGNTYRATDYSASGLFYKYQINNDKYCLSYGKHKSVPKTNYDILVSTPKLRKNGVDIGSYLIINEVVCFKFGPNMKIKPKRISSNGKSYYGLPHLVYGEDDQLKALYIISYIIKKDKILECTISNTKTGSETHVKFDDAYDCATIVDSDLVNDGKDRVITGKTVTSPGMTKYTNRITGTSYLESTDDGNPCQDDDNTTIGIVGSDKTVTVTNNINSNESIEIMTIIPDPNTYNRVYTVLEWRKRK